MKTFIERIRLSPVPFEVNLNLTSQKLPRTIPRKNPTTVVFPEFFKYCKIIQNLVLTVQKPLIYKAFSEFSKNFNFPTIFSVSSKHFQPTKEKENPFSQDGVHPKGFYYSLWAKNMAEYLKKH